MPPDALICTKFKIFWGFAPDTTGGAYIAPRPQSHSWFRGGAHWEREGGRGGEEGEGTGSGGRPGMPQSRVGKPTGHPSLAVDEMHVINLPGLT